MTMTTVSLRQYRFHYPHHPAPTQSQGSLLDYWVASNGVFALAQRPGLSALMPISAHSQPIPGLGPLQPWLKLPLVPISLVQRMVTLAQAALPNEILFHLVLAPGGGDWGLTVPRQSQGPNHCKPLDTGPDSSAHRALMEVHSHGTHPAYFSRTDDQDERSGFRLYGVLGRLHQGQPELLLRVGLMGHFWVVPMAAVFSPGEAGVRDRAPAHAVYYGVDSP
ncbi:Mov34/MPN/PAD-1 family protein [Leptolyngbya sp. PCC 6406]|uniref:Mov34/MPN/PAD-1 family protein n=1 Tax=Leptolyngbya sp. PCC 6406 TaxID=1173264 RepID=UPI0002ABE306|nr:Mov34/MPN/PAD-1 family protein [Leptolyngbya sp. PCC 6406]